MDTTQAIVRHPFRLTAAVAVLAALLLALVGCGSSGDGDSVGPASGSVENGFAGREDSPAGAPDDVGEAEESAEQDGASDRAGSARSAPQTRAVISKGTVSLRSEDVTGARFDVLEVVDRLDGEVSDEQTATGEDGEVSHSRLVIRVPSASFGQAMTELAEVAELVSSSRSSEDVTTQVIDVEARIRAQERSLRRVEALLAQARDLQDIVAIETQLTQRQADLDSLKSQQAWLAGQTSLSRIAVHLARLDTEEVEDEERAGFLTGLREGWEALTAFVLGGSRVAGVLLPFALLFGLVGLGLWPLARSVRRRREAVVPAEGPVDDD